MIKQQPKPDQNYRTNEVMQPSIIHKSATEQRKSKPKNIDFYAMTAEDDEMQMPVVLQDEEMEIEPIASSVMLQHEQAFSYGRI